MKATEFCYWLQGYFEIYGASTNPGNSLTGEQVELIQMPIQMQHQLPMTESLSYLK
jgi:hypothetical protein